MTYKITIPFYANENLLDNLMSGMDIDWRHILIVDNSPGSLARKYEGKGAKILYHPENLGVAKSWNIGLKGLCDWTFFVSINATFPNGFSEVLAELNKANEWVMLTDLSWHCNAVSKKTVEKIGYFDENFYPAYFEDTDYYHRMCLAGIPCGKNGVISIPAETTRQANSLDGGLKVNFKALLGYYKEKWGGEPGSETFPTPWNKGKLDYWVRENLNALKEKYKV